MITLTTLIGRTHMYLEYEDFSLDAEGRQRYNNPNNPNSPSNRDDRDNRYKSESVHDSANVVSGEALVFHQRSPIPLLSTFIHL